MIKKVKKLLFKNKEDFLRKLRDVFLLGIFACVVVLLFMAPNIVIPNVFMPVGEKHVEALWIYTLIFWLLISLAVGMIIRSILQNRKLEKEISKRTPYSYINAPDLDLQSREELLSRIKETGEE